MAIDEREVRHVAALARLGLDEARVPALATELDGILRHMDVLQRVDVGAAHDTAAPPAGMALRDDAGPGDPLARPPEAFAPQAYDGFLLVPRLATHEDAEA